MSTDLAHVAICSAISISKHAGSSVTDLTLAKENQASFEEYLSNNANASPGIDSTVTVLTTGFWPSYKSFHLNLPVEMTKHRKLTWIYSLGTSNIIGKFEPKTMELIVTTSFGGNICWYVFIVGCCTASDQFF
ncbi:hypothetical protein MLD38_016335 [Melastoma candidum]|uniref:Uncharacterized protein n=1 Tax=Melastoma candidum TaxID=119954 RepID=A0ACB9RNA7_9MYRT|nr:hypothetical protein MLD38_016335 [Melastoma candidum]